MYMQRVKLAPQLGKEREMQQHLEAWVKTSQGQGRQIGLAVQAFAPEGQVFVLTLRFADLAALDQFRQRQRTDEAFHDYRAKTSALSRLPAQIELLEVLVPLQDGR